MPYDFFMSRYKEAYVQETKAFASEYRNFPSSEPSIWWQGHISNSWSLTLSADALVNDLPSPCTGEDGLMALIMAIAAGKSAEEGRWVSFDEIEEVQACRDPEHCEIIDPREYAIQGSTISK